MTHEQQIATELKLAREYGQVVEAALWIVQERIRQANSRIRDELGCITGDVRCEKSRALSNEILERLFREPLDLDLPRELTDEESELQDKVRSDVNRLIRHAVGVHS